MSQAAPPLATITEHQASDTPLTQALRTAFAEALGGHNPLPSQLLALEGMSGRRYRHFIHRLIGLVARPRYLEVGCWAGSTLCSALHGNTLRAFAVDNWSEFGGPSRQFLANVATFIGEMTEFNMLTSDFRQVDWRGVGRFNVYLFDGPHGEVDQFDGVALALPALDEEFVLIVDDWNWPEVRDGTFRAIAERGLTLLHGFEVRTTLDGSHPAVSRQHSDWHNGYFMAVLRQPMQRMSMI